MRLMLNTCRCLRKSYIFVVIWIFGFSVYSLTVGNVSLARDSATLGRLGDRRAAQENGVLYGQLLQGGEHVAENEADNTEREIRKRVVNSRAGNFTYVSRGNSSIFDSSRGQFRVIDRYLKKMEHGFFVELGSEGNEPASLTFLLEKSRGWTGLVIEPEAEKFQSLMHMKRNSKFLQSCINATSEVWPAEGSSEEPCLRLVDILKAIKRNKIDLLVLDVTGQEVQLLTSFPFKDIDVSMINVEIHGMNRYPVQLVQKLKTQFESVQFMTNHIYGKSDMVFLNKQFKS
ncbi:uncharacterized protein LOC123554040 [Mercenaria mercenaria]|uniref:uncharacterized protein LOC123554040 n=1 Tax=Mercenaria mercenaria TaxID=6596 RepID=UPI00234EEC3E|nr:uncharacterized protein LOC123554040 [Mercenaria mercenaria]